MKSPPGYFSTLRDPRAERPREHNLEDILFITIASAICGAESRNDMEKFGIAKEERLKTFFLFPEVFLHMIHLIVCFPLLIRRSQPVVSCPGHPQLRNSWRMKRLP
jgi:hypothetical protein